MIVPIIFASIFVTTFAETPGLYPASGWRPQGQQFNLPSRQIQQTYGAPSTPISSKQYASPVNQYSSPNNQYGTPNNQGAFNNQYAAANNQYAEPNNQYGSPVNQNLPNEQPARNFADNNFAPNRVNLNPNYDSQNPHNNINNQQYNPQNTDSINRNRFRQQQQQNNQFDRLRQNNQNRQNQNQNEEIGRNDFGASNVDIQNARRPFNNQPQNNADGNINRNLSNEDEEILFNEDGHDDSTKANKDVVNKYDAPTTQRSIRGRKSEKTTAVPVTKTELPDTNSEQPNNVAISTAVAGSENTGQYYILQPDGRLQRVVFMTSEDKTNDKNAAFIANIMYETVEPLKGPIYSYNADNQLVRIN